MMDVTMTHVHYLRTTQRTTDKPDPIIFLTVVVSTSGRVYADFVRRFSAFLACASWGSIFAELPESDQFLCLQAARLANLKDL